MFIEQEVSRISSYGLGTMHQQGKVVSQVVSQQTNLDSFQPALDSWVGLALEVSFESANLLADICCTAQASRFAIQPWLTVVERAIGQAKLTFLD
jgi:hypothetical protein